MIIRIQAFQTSEKVRRYNREVILQTLSGLPAVQPST